jgi:uncharacterized protein (TIGR03790 family)
MSTRRLLLPAFVLLCLVASARTLPAQAQRESYDDVMLVINERSAASREIGAFFAQRRAIPERNIYRMNIDTSESIDSSRFVLVRWQMKEWMRQQGIVDSINYIVTTKGVPLRVRTSQWDRFDSLGRLVSLGGQASFEDCIALMNGEDSSLALAVKFSFPINRYYESTKRFRRDPQTMPIYLVTRLDAYTVEQVKDYIVRAETPAIMGEGLWVLDADPGKDGNPGYKVGNDWLRGANDVLRDRGMNVVYNGDTAYLRNRTGVIGYASWGSNDSYSGGREGAVPKNTWLNGSLAETFVSTGGRTFMSGSSGGQSLIADWIAEGACGVKGYTDEPYLSAIAHPDILFDRYTAGFNMAESFYAASVFAAWRQVVIGDPKMKLGSMVTLSDEQIDFGTTTRGTLLYDTISVRNNMNAPLLLNGVSLTGANADDFTVTVPGASFPVSIATGASFDVIVGFAPTGYFAREATVVIAHRGEGDPRDFNTMVQLTGTVTQPALMAPTSYDFGAVAIASSAEFTISAGTTVAGDTLHINNFSKSGAGASRFTVTTTPTLPTSLTGGATLDLRIVYSPSGATRDSATLVIYTLNGGQPTRIKLYGTGAVSSAPETSSLASLGVTVTPNPATARAEVRFALKRPGQVRVELLDLLGRSVRGVLNSAMPEGDHRVALDVEDLAAGSYLCRVEIIDGDGATRTHVAQVVRR